MGRHAAGHTRAFDDQVAWLVTHCSKSAVVELMRVACYALWKNPQDLTARQAAKLASKATWRRSPPLPTRFYKESS